MNNNGLEKFSQPKFLLPIIIILAATVRIIFFMGHVFSDDSYYSQLAISFLEGNYPSGFIGYPIHLARKLVTVLTAVGFSLFGKNEIGTIAIPFIFSILSVPLIYAIAKEIFNQKIALISAFILAFFPTDIIFATLSFADLLAAFFINFGIYYLILYNKDGEIKYSFFAGMYFAISIFAKMSFYYVGILLVLLILYQLIKDRKLNSGLLVSIAIPVSILFIEALIYGSKTGDYLYRIHLVEENYNYTYYNFFPYTILGSEYSGWEYFIGVIKQIFVENTISIFARRFYLFIPILAFVQSILLIRVGRQKLVVYWFSGLVILLAFFTTSPLIYRPLDLNLSWYIYPLFFPSIILTSSFISRFSFRVRTLYFTIILIASIVMSLQYQEYFGLTDKNEFKQFLKDHDTEIILTDHHTKYGIDLVDGYPFVRRTKNITDQEWPVTNISPGALVIYNPQVVNELVKQGHKFYLFTELFSEDFELVDVIAGYEIYRKLEVAN